MKIKYIKNGADILKLGALYFIYTVAVLYACRQSAVFLKGMAMIAILVILMILLFKQKIGDNFLSILIILPYEFYITLLYWKNSYLFLILLVLILLIIYVRTESTTNTNKKVIFKSQRKCTIRNTLKRYPLVLISIFSMTAACLASYIDVQSISDTSSVKTPVNGKQVTNSNQTIANNIETLLLLQEEQWVKLETMEKLNVLQTVANIESRYLGLSYNMNVELADLQTGVSASYDDNNYTIYISADHIKTGSAADLLDSCCHEAYHSYQHRIVDIYKNSNDSDKGLRLFKEAASYESEFNDYTSPQEGYGIYYYQECEKRARDYAAEAVSDYYREIYQHLYGSEDPSS